MRRPRACGRCAAVLAIGVQPLSVLLLLLLLSRLRNALQLRRGAGGKLAAWRVILLRLRRHQRQAHFVLLQQRVQRIVQHRRCCRAACIKVWDRGRCERMGTYEGMCRGKRAGAAQSLKFPSNSRTCFPAAPSMHTPSLQVRVPINHLTITAASACLPMRPAVSPRSPRLHAGRKLLLTAQHQHQVRQLPAELDNTRDEWQRGAGSQGTVASRGMGERCRTRRSGHGTASAPVGLWGKRQHRCSQLQARSCSR